MTSVSRRSFCVAGALVANGVLAKAGLASQVSGERSDADARIALEVERLIARMTPEEKAGQITARIWRSTTLRATSPTPLPEP